MFVGKIGTTKRARQKKKIQVSSYRSQPFFFSLKFLILLVFIFFNQFIFPVKSHCSDSFPSLSILRTYSHLEYVTILLSALDVVVSKKKSHIPEAVSILGCKKAWSVKKRGCMDRLMQWTKGRWWILSQKSSPETFSCHTLPLFLRASFVGRPLMTMDSGSNSLPLVSFNSQVEILVGFDQIWCFTGFIGTEVMALSTEGVMLAHETYCFPLVFQIISGS